MSWKRYVLFGAATSVLLVLNRGCKGVGFALSQPCSKNDVSARLDLSQNNADSRLTASCTQLMERLLAATGCALLVLPRPLQRNVSNMAAYLPWMRPKDNHTKLPICSHRCTGSTPSQPHSLCCPLGRSRHRFCLANYAVAGIDLDADTHVQFRIEYAAGSIYSTHAFTIQNVTAGLVFRFP